MNTRFDQAELQTLIGLNKQREALQERLMTQAERLFKLWCELNPSHGWKRIRSTEATEHGIKIQYDSGCSCCRDRDTDEVYLPLETFYDERWETQTKAEIQQRKEKERNARLQEEERSGRAQLAQLRAKFPD